MGNQNQIASVPRPVAGADGVLHAVGHVIQIRVTDGGADHHPEGTVRESLDRSSGLHGVPPPKGERLVGQGAHGVEKREQDMSFFTVDAEKCTLCGACLDECPFALLEMKTRSSVPTPREIAVRSAEERCINCGHCVVICATDALTLHPTPHADPSSAGQCPEELLPIRPELQVTKEQVAHQLMARRTHRGYLERHVPRETIEELINVARYAPSGHNGQQAKWLVVSDKNEVRALGQTVVDFMKAVKDPSPDLPFAWDYHGTDSDCIVDLWESGVDSVFRGAPHTAILYGDPGMENLYAGRIQFAIRLTYLELAAEAEGLGTVWNGFFVAALQMWPGTREAVARLLPEGQVAYDSMSFGYPKNLYRRIPRRNEASIIWK